MDADQDSGSPGKSPIGTLAESSLHAALKEIYARPGDWIEAEVDGFIIDLLRGRVLVEFQTGNFAGVRRKLEILLADHPVRLVYPIPRVKWIIRQARSGSFISRRKSPKRGRFEEVFTQLVYMPGLLLHPNLSLEVLLTHEEEIYRDDGRGSWRRKGWSLVDRVLLDIRERAILSTAQDYLGFIPTGLVTPFTNRDLSDALDCRASLAQKMTYTLRNCGLLEEAGRRGRAYLYQISNNDFAGIYDR